MGGVSAQITTVTVGTAAELKKVIADTGTIEVKLTSDIAIDTTLEVSRAVTLDLNGYVLQYKNNDGKKGSVIKVEQSGNLTIKDSNTANQTYYFDVDSTSGLWTWNQNATSGGNFVTGGIITGGTGTSVGGSNYGGGIYLAGGQCTMTGGSIVGCQGRNGGGVCIGGGGAFTMKQGSNIIGCKADNTGGGVSAQKGSFDMESGEIAFCIACYSGGGVEVSSTAGRFIMHGDAAIRSCKATQYKNQSGIGGGVAAWGYFCMRGNSEITNCTAGEQNNGKGGGVSAGNFEMSGNAVIANCAASKGGGVYNLNTTTISDHAQIDGTIYNQWILNANGGTVTDKVTNKNENESAEYFIGKITGDSTGGDTIFTNEVENKKKGVIEKGIFKNKVTNEAGGIIAGGIFEGTVTNEAGGTISGGTFEGEVKNNGTINNGTFNGNVTNESGGTINGGTFYGTVTGIDETAYHIVTFQSDNKDYAKQYIIATTTNAKATKPLAPTKSGYTVVGWYNGSTPWDFENDTVTQSMTLSAKWTAVSSSSGGYYEWPQTPQISCGNGGKAVLSADGKTLTITPDAGKEIDKVLLNSKDLGAVPAVTNLKTGDKVEVSFKDKVTEPTKEELDKQVKEAASKASLKARSVKLKDGRLQITVSSDVQDLQALGYTVKYKYYRSTRKASGYKAALEKAGTIYTTGKGTKGTRYYYKARLMIYDKDGKLIAKSELKQCRYATRILRK